MNNIFDKKTIDLFFKDFAVDIELLIDGSKIKAQFIQKEKDLNDFQNYSLEDEFSQVLMYIKKDDLKAYEIKKGSYFTFEDDEFEIASISQTFEPIVECKIRKINGGIF